MEIPVPTEQEIIAFIAVTLVPTIVDILRVGLFQIAMRLKWQTLADITTTSRFGLLTTMGVSLGFGVVLSIWLGDVEPTIQSISLNSVAVLGWSQAVYKGGYEKLEIRKTITTVIDKIGPSSEQIDTPADEMPSVG